MRLQGAGQLTANTRAAFEKATEAFYADIYSSNQRTLRHYRRLEKIEFLHFDTDVTATGESLDANGNTIVYNQMVRFFFENTVDDSKTRELLLIPLTNEKQQSLYLTILHEADQAFRTVQSVKTESRLSPSGDENGRSAGIIIAIAAAGVLLCCFGFGVIAHNLFSSGKKSEDDSVPESPFALGNEHEPLSSFEDE